MLDHIEKVVSAHTPAGERRIEEVLNIDLVIVRYR